MRQFWEKASILVNTRQQLQQFCTDDSSLQTYKRIRIRAFILTNTRVYLANLNRNRGYSASQIESLHLISGCNWSTERC